MEQLINQIVHDRYQIQSLLGRQIGRRTFLAADLETQAAVVLKLLLFGPDFTWEDFKLFEREAATLKTLDHLAIPQYLDSFEIETARGKGFALVQSFIEARSLQVWAESGRAFSEAELKAIATQLLDVLTYLHSRQPPVIHRDIKPSNILLGDRSGNSPGQIYLVDFGSVQTISHPGTITVVGTYGYMPPEQFGGRATPASDLYSLGATLIYLLIRKHPADLPRRRGQLQFDATSQVSDRFQAWLRSLVHPDVDQRPSTAQRALETLQNEQLPLPNNLASRSKPAGSRVLLTKADTQLHIRIPAMPLPQKLKAIRSTVFGTIFLSLPLLFFKVSPGIGWLVTPFVGWLILDTWAKALYTAFEEIQVLIGPQSIRYSTRSWLGQSKERSSPIQDITRLETSQAKHVHTHKIEIPALNIWAGNHCYALSSQGSSGNLRKLTQPEIDWLALELSDWLDLPLLISNESRQSPVSSNDREQPSAKTTQSSLTHSKNLPEVKRPVNAKCTLEKTPESLEISAPASSQNTLFLLGCIACFFLGPLYLTAVASSAVVNPWMGLAVGAAPIILWQLGRLLNRRGEPERVLLRINSQTISLWKKSNPENCLNQVSTASICRLQVVYKSTSKGTSGYHVQLATTQNPSSYRSGDKVLVGNRQFWLSQQEAYWLAYELSTWLKLPVAELEVIENTSA